MNPTPLPEQGGFNEKLTEILSNFWHYQNDHGKDRGITFDEARTAIRTLIREEIIGEDVEGLWNELFPNDRGSGRDVDELKNLYNNELRAEQRKRLEDTHGTK